MSNETRQSSSLRAVSQFGIITGASSLVVYGLLRRNKTGAALATAGGLIAYQQARSNGRSKRSTSAVFRVNASPAEAYRLWHDFSNLPRFMAHLESVRVLDDRHSEWTAKGPFDSLLRWHAEITEDQPDRRISWRSLQGSQVFTSGSVEFLPDPQGRGCMVRANVEYADPLGKAGHALMTALGKHPSFVVKEDLRRFKALLEAGETPTTAGQPHGPRGVRGQAEQVLFRETSNRAAPQGRPQGQSSSAA